MLPVLAVAGLMLAVPELSPPTLKAFERYVSVTEVRIRAERSGALPAFWIDRQSERIKASAWQKHQARGATWLRDQDTTQQRRPR